MVNYVKGNLLDSDCDYICHQVNCQGVMGSGIARQIRERWPRVYDGYKNFCKYVGSDSLLGKVFIRSFAPKSLNLSLKVLMLSLSSIFTFS